MGASFGSASGKQREIIPEGQYDTICYLVVELGTHTRVGSFGEKTNPELMIGFEIPELTITYEKDGKEVTAPRVINQKFNQSLGEKANLRKFLESWRGKSFTDDDLKTFTPDKVIGVGATLSIEHSKDGKYANIKSIAPLHKSVKLGAPYNETINFGISDLNTALFDKLYPWIQNIIKESAEYKGFTVEEPVIQRDEPAVVDEDDIPF